MLKEHRLFFIGLGMATISAISYVLCIDYICFPWLDEIGTSDTAVNVTLYGDWVSHVWKYSYNPLHAFILIPWLMIWGVSHLSVCSFTVLLSFISYVILLRILLKRSLLSTTLGVVVFTLLYWGGFEFARLITLGRIDILVMLFSILVVNELTPMADGRFYSAKRWATLIYSFLLMAASIYTIPLLVCYSFLFYFITKDKAVRQELRWRFLLSVLGILASFVLICLFYYSVHGLFKFVNSYMSFNATINHNNQGTGLAERLIAAYSTDIYAFIVWAIAAAIFGFKRNKNKHLSFYLLFILCIPGLMVFAGRYRFYYSWIFYVPVIIIAAYAFEKVHQKWRTAVLLGAVIVSTIIRPAVYSKEFSENRAHLKSAEEFVNQCSSFLKERDNVVFFNSLFYYALVERRYNLWQKYEGLQKMPQPKEKFQYFVERAVKDTEKRQKLLDLFNKIEYCDPYLPKSGYIFTDGKMEFMNAIRYMKTHDYFINKVYGHKGYRLLKYAKVK